MMLNIQAGPIIRQYVVVIIANLSVLCVGLGLAWPSPVLVKLRNETETVLPHPITEEQGSWIVSIGFLSGCLAFFTVSFLVDHIGRKYCLLLSSVPRLVCCVLLTFASDIWMILLAKAINGWSDSFTFAVVPMYASEIASKEVRGSLGTILQIVCSTGIVIMLCMGPFTSYVPLNVIFTCLVIVTTIPIMFLPDSPYFLYSKGRNVDAIKVLTFLRGSETLAAEELKEYSKTETDTKLNKREILKDRVFLKALGIVTLIGIGLQVTGFNAVTFYLQTVLESTQTSVRPEIASVVIGLIQLTASICTTLVTDRFGRKPILCTTLVGMTFGMVGLGTFFKIKENSDQITGFMNYMPLASLILVVFCFSAGLGSLNWPLTAELFDGRTRALGLSISILPSIISIFLTTKYFSLLTNSIGPAATYWIFAINCMLMCLFILFCVPETKGKSFDEIQIALGSRKSDGDKKIDKY